MRLLILIAGLVLNLPAIAQGAESAGCKTGPIALAGSTFPGSLEQPDGTEYRFRVEFRADCSFVYTVIGRKPETGEWSWIGGAMLAFVTEGNTAFVGAVGSGGYVRGDVESDNLKGSFTLYPADNYVSSVKGQPQAIGLFPCGQGEFSVAGAVWKGRGDWVAGDQDAVTMVFRSDCTVAFDYGYPTNGSATWRQDGSRLTILMNGGYATIETSVRPDRIEGSMRNEQGKTGTFYVVRQP